MFFSDPQRLNPFNNPQCIHHSPNYSNSLWICFLPALTMLCKIFNFPPQKHRWLHKLIHHALQAVQLLIDFACFLSVV